MKQTNRFRLWHIPVLVVLTLATIHIMRTNDAAKLPYQSEEGPYSVPYIMSNTSTAAVCMPTSWSACLQ